MKRLNVLQIGLLAGALAAGTAAGAQALAPTAHAAKVAKVGVRHTSLGKILVESSGFTLYAFTHDPRGKDTCLNATASEGYSTSHCVEVWPPLITSGKPIANAGVKSSLLSSLRLPDGRKQVTYAGHPLYRYAPASERGETGYAGTKQFGGAWDALTAAGKLVK
jgi:predicted lipoprotein with Yx(FWY)xxD motif